jgi:hypothetical protein
MRRSFLICGLVVMAGLALYFLPPVVVDDALIASWRVNRSTFDQLVGMYLADDLDQNIGFMGPYSVQPAYPGPPTPFIAPTPAPTRVPYPGPGYIAPGDEVPLPTPTVAPPPVGVSYARRLGYIALMQRVGVVAFGGERRNYPGPPREIIFLLTFGEDIRQLIWAKEPLGVGQEAVDPTRCRRLEANWYFCSWVSAPD